MPETIPNGIVNVTKNNFFTYIATQSGGVAHRWAVQIWNVPESGWSFQIYTGGQYQFNGKTETNTFHKKHLVTLGKGQDLSTKFKDISDNRSDKFIESTKKRNARSGEFMKSIKSAITDAKNSKDQTKRAREAAAENYFVKGYGNKLSGVPTLTFIDCSQFSSQSELASKFAQALLPGANRTAPGAEEFKSGGIWHPTVDFGVDCVYEYTNNTLSAPKQKAKVQVHLLEVAGTTVKCHIHHLANAV